MSTMPSGTGRSLAKGSLGKGSDEHGGARFAEVESGGLPRLWHPPRYDELANGRQLLDFVQWLKGLYDSSGPITRPAQVCDDTARDA